MAENLNYSPSIGNSACYNNEPSNCAIYGRLYNWATAMALTSSCNSNRCSSQIQSPHRGICPSGWHLPSDDDWDVLVAAVGGYNSATRTKLKATSGWNGTDEYGFSALPGGKGDRFGRFDDVVFRGYWWSAFELDDDEASFQSIYYNGYAGNINYHKSYLFSVRCLQD
jgi:uncharacterized protein (TIGR02145 family)